MSKLLIVEDSIIVRAVFKELLEDVPDFECDFADSYAEAKSLLAKRRYEFSVVERILKDAQNGEIIALLNKHNLAPIVFTQEISEDFFEEFEAAQIIEYVKKVKYNNEAQVIQKLLQLKANKAKTVLIVSDSKIYSRYLKQSLTLHGFKVFNAHNDSEAKEKLDLHPETSLMIVDPNDSYVNALELVQYARESFSSKELKILILSEETNSFFTSSMLSAGADDFLVKDFSRDEFYVRVYQNINFLC